MEDLQFVRPRERITERLARYAHELCKILPTSQVAQHLNLDWKTVKRVDKRFLEDRYGETNYEGLRLIGVDEIAVRKKKARQQLTRIVELNQTISTMLVLKVMLKRIWGYKYRAWAQRRLEEWCEMARSVGYECVSKFASRLENYSYGILNHCDYPIGTSRLEGGNNIIKVIKRQAFGYHDVRYFALKIIQAFNPT